MHVVSSLMTWMKWGTRPVQPAHTDHKEEMEAKFKADAKDRNVLQDNIGLFIDPLDPDQHQDGLVNVVPTKIVVHQSVNVNNSIALGKTALKAFEKSWPIGFYATISKSVNTMAMARKNLKIGDIKVFDTETIYARAMCLQSTSRNIDTEDLLLAHEISSYPTSMFDAAGQSRGAKIKANLKNAFKVVEIYSRNADTIDTVFLDGCAVLWVVPWPAAGTVQDNLDRFQSYLHTRMYVYFIFDR